MTTKEKHGDIWIDPASNVVFELRVRRQWDKHDQLVNWNQWNWNSIVSNQNNKSWKW